MRGQASRCINHTIAALFSPYGVVLTFVALVLVHVLAALLGYVGNFFTHYVLALSELALVITAMVGHSTLLSSKAESLKEDAIVRALPGADNRLVGAEDLPEATLDELKSQVGDVQGGEPQGG